MTVIQKTIGRLPVNLGDYDSTKSYGKKNRVLLYGCEWESKVENNTYAPATLNTTTGVITPDTTHWKLISGSCNTWLIDNGYKKVDAANVKDGNNTQHEINNAVANEIGTNSTPSSIKGRVTNLESAVGSGGSVDSRIASAVNTEKNRAEGVESGHNTRIEALETAVGSGGSVDSRISSAVAVEAERAQAAEADRYTKSETYTKTEVNGLVDTPHQEYVTVDAYANLPATGSKDTIYRVSNYNGSTSQVDASVYSEYAWNGSQYVFLCVKSQIGEVFDISVYNNNAKYADLAAALNGGANIPQSLQKGGMSVKFVQSSDNKYVQYTSLTQSFSTMISDWVCDTDLQSINLTTTTEATYGYINSQGEKRVSDSTIITKPISFAKGEKIIFTAQADTNLAVICKFDQATGKYTPVVIGISPYSQFRDYEYTVTENGLFCFCCYSFNNYDLQVKTKNSVVFWRDIIEKTIANLSPTYEDVEVEYTPESGHFINGSGNIVANESYSLSSVIHIPENCDVYVTACGGYGISIISMCNENGENIIPLVKDISGSDYSTPYDYWYHFDNEVYIILSFFHGNGNATISVKHRVNEPVEQTLQRVYKPGSKYISYIPTKGMCITSYGRLMQAQNWSITNPYYVIAGESIHIEAYGTSDCCILASCNKDVGNIHPLVLGKDSQYDVWNSYDYIAQESGYYITSYVPYNNKDAAIIIATSNMYNGLQQAQKDILLNKDSSDEDFLKISCGSISCFDNIAICGDSYAIGSTDATGTMEGHPNSSWGKTLQKESGVNVTLYAKGGATTESFITDTLPSLLADNQRQLYLLCLGINDAGYGKTIGTISDIHEDWHDNPDTFYGNYGQIIDRIKDFAPNALLIICKTLLPYYQEGDYYNPTSTAIEEIAEHYGIPYIETNDVFYLQSKNYNTNISLHNGHPTATMYGAIARVMRYKIEDCMNNNIEYFEGFYNP